MPRGFDPPPPVDTLPDPMGAETSPYLFGDAPTLIGLVMPPATEPVTPPAAPAVVNPVDARVAKTWVPPTPVGVFL